MSLHFKPLEQRRANETKISEIAAESEVDLK